MAHGRQSIRNAVVTALTGLTTTGARVYPVRKYPGQEDKLPCLLVYTPEESAEVLTMTGGMSSRRIGRSLQVVVHGVAKSTANLENTLDTMALEVETALANGVTGVKDMWLTATQTIFTDDGQQPLGNVRMVFTAVYHTTAADPGTIIA